MSDTSAASVLLKVRKLLAKAEATDNANEAEAFSAKAAELIAAHRIDAARLAAADGSTTRLAVRDVAVGRGVYVRGRLALLGAVASAHDCELVWRSGPMGTTAMLAGFVEDLDATAVLYESLHLQVASQMAAVRRSTAAATQRWRRAFLFGFAARIDELLADARRSAVHDARATGSMLPDLPARAAQVTTYHANGVRPGRRRPGAEPGRGRGVGPRSPLRRWRRPRASTHPRAPGDRTGTVTPAASCPDHGRAAVYAAEEAAFGGTDLDDRRPLGDLRALAAAIVEGEWWRSTGAPTVEVVAARADAGSSSARADGGSHVVVRLAGSQCTASTLAHELAHALAGVGHGHDERFRAAHVDVVAMIAGRALATGLDRSYVDHGVPGALRAWPAPRRASGRGFVIVP